MRTQPLNFPASRPVRNSKRQREGPAPGGGHPSRHPGPQDAAQRPSQPGQKQGLGEELYEDVAAHSPQRVDVNEEDQSALVIVPDQQLSLAIGREGQNARLAARLTGWRIDIKSESQFHEAVESVLLDRMSAVADDLAAYPEFAGRGDDAAEMELPESKG